MNIRSFNIQGNAEKYGNLHADVEDLLEQRCTWTSTFERLWHPALGTWKLFLTSTFRILWKFIENEPYLDDVVGENITWRNKSETERSLNFTSAQRMKHCKEGSIYFLFYTQNFATVTYPLSCDKNISFLWTLQETWDLVSFKRKLDPILMVHNTTMEEKL